MTTQVYDGEILSSRHDDIRLYEGVLTRRMLAFCLDYLFVGLLLVPFGIVVFLLGVVTLGLGWALFGILAPAVAILYVAMTLGGANEQLAKLGGLIADEIRGGKAVGDILQ